MVADRDAAYAVSVLGPLIITAPGGEVKVAGAKVRALFALLALEHGRHVHPDEIMEVLWGDSPPPTAANGIQVYVAAIRRALRERDADFTIQTSPGGYLLELPDNALDRDDFLTRRRDAAAAAATGNPQTAIEGYRQALRLWRGPALSDFDPSEGVRVRAEYLNQLELETFEDASELELMLGKARAVIPALTRRTAQKPLRERLWGLLALARYQAGEQAAALDTLRGIRTALRDELGVEPGPELRALELRVLRQSEDLLPQPPVKGVARTITVQQRDAITRGFGLRLADGSTVALDRANITIGRGDDCDVVISEGSISSRHARVATTRAGHQVEDLGSRNGTMLNGEFISTATLAEGDVLRLGRSELVYERVEKLGNAS
ncbi:MAG: BTAD domain-containing putative transcriptional regulator [Rhodoglobus sp.]